MSFYREVAWEKTELETSNADEYRRIDSDQ